jgi:hypothetical protein
MATPPNFVDAEILYASQLNKIGMWLVSTTNIGSAVATVTTGTVFSSDYDNYRVVVEGVKTSVASDLLVNFGATVTGYYGSAYFDNYNGAATGVNRRNNGANLFIGGVETILGEQVSTFDVANPWLTTSTSIAGNYYGNGYSGWLAGTQANAASFSTLTIRPLAGTMTGGKIYVYGYRYS